MIVKIKKYSKEKYSTYGLIFLFQNLRPPSNKYTLTVRPVRLAGNQQTNQQC